MPLLTVATFFIIAAGQGAPRNLETFADLTRLIDGKSDPSLKKIEVSVRSWKFGSPRVSYAAVRSRMREDYKEYEKSRSHSALFKVVCEIVYFRDVAESEIPNYSDFVFGKPLIRCKEYARLAILSSARTSNHKGAIAALDKLVDNYNDDPLVVGEFVFSNATLTPFGERHLKGHKLLEGLLVKETANRDYALRTGIVGYGYSYMLSGNNAFKEKALKFGKQLLAMPTIESYVRVRVDNFCRNVLPNYKPPK